MADRFFCADLSNTSATLDGPEAHHALHVLRLNVGSEIHLFDGRGTSVIGVVDATGRREVVVSIQQRHFTEQQDSGQVIVAASPPKGDRMKWMIEKLTELGVDQFIPLRTHRTIVDAGKSKREKLEATIISAAKQCGRDWLMKVTEPVDFKTLISNTAGQHSLHIAHPYPIGKTATDTATNDPPSKRRIHQRRSCVCGSGRSNSAGMARHNLTRRNSGDHGGHRPVRSDAHEVSGTVVQDWIEEREAASLPKCHPWKLTSSIREAIAD
jgi:16S rRNA (uracil1498-N3)-methyltransferase